MKKGIARIIAGVPLIVLQIMSFAGNAKAGSGIRLSFASPTLFAYDLIVLVSYCFVGIVGAILLVSGLIAYFKPNVHNDAHTKNKEEKAATPRQRYCKFCGGPVDGQSKKCTKCGKQYFRVTKAGVILCSLCFLVLLLSVVVIRQNHQITEMESEISELTEQMDFCSKNVVFVSNDGTNYYHYLGCPEFYEGSFRVYRPGEAVGKGYGGCPICG